MAVTKGIRTRSTPDWFPLYLSQGAGFLASIAGTHFVYISLYNNSLQGAFLFVYGVFPVAANSVFLNFYSIQGTLGAFDHNCTRVNPIVGSPTGQIFLHDNDTVQLPNTPISLISAFAGSGVLSDAPLFIVPAGYSLTAGSDASAGGVACGFTYIPFLDLKGTRPI